MKVIDSHIHLDQYNDEEIACLFTDSKDIDAVISVSNNLQSCKRNLQLSREFPKVNPAFGYHPEQPLPVDEEKSGLLKWIDRHQEDCIAIGEVGLPYYLKLENKITASQFEQYVELLDTFIQLSKRYSKPVVLHTVYEDAPIVCDLLEKHSYSKAHFHWFKGDDKTVTRMIENGYYISITPDVVYKNEIQNLVRDYPLEQMMVETDGPWPFKGPFLGQMTHPAMIQESIKSIAKIKRMNSTAVSEILLNNTKGFYQLPSFEITR